MANLKIVGYQMRYEGWPKDHWQFFEKHPGPIPEAHAPRRIRVVYANLDEPAEKQVYVRPPAEPVCPYDDPAF